MQENEVFVVDLTGSNTSGEIINSISLALEIPSASGKKIHLKLKDAVLNQSQLLSIKSLITSYGSSLAKVETHSEATYSACESVGISAVNLAEPVVESAEPYDSAGSTISTVQTPSEFSLNTPENTFDQSSISAESAAQGESPVLFEPEQEVVFENQQEAEQESLPAHQGFVESFVPIAPEACQEGERQIIGVYKKAEEENEQETYEEVDFFAPPTDEPVVADPKQTIYVTQTLRSGQILEFDGNVVIIGDCHPGSEIKASGDITVWGVLGSIAHAGAKGNREAKIRALKMHAVQLRIANCYSRRPDCNNIPYIVKSHTFTPEEARIVDDGIVLFKIG
ncbi:septum site-determining protein MinC [Candidatus Gastranaerophilus sp. (ex Termes propinquus)]|nr:septum site-determining protein MinC [Candidatus Gastranaerophilus sp. (ex Termes propinquus)]